MAAAAEVVAEKGALGARLDEVGGSGSCFAKPEISLFSTSQPSNLPSLLRAIFVAAGGQHDDWDEFDAVMVRERRFALLVDPQRVENNPGARAKQTQQRLSSLTGPTEDERKYE